MAPPEKVAHEAQRPALSSKRPTRRRSTKRKPLPEVVQASPSRTPISCFAFRARRTENGFSVQLEAEVKRKLAPVVREAFNPSGDARFDIDAGEPHQHRREPPGHARRRHPPRRSSVPGSRQAGTRRRLPVDKNAQPKFTTAEPRRQDKRAWSRNTSRTIQLPPRGRTSTGSPTCSTARSSRRARPSASTPRWDLARSSAASSLAPSIGDGEMVDTPGGGVGQFGTTLYNALFDGGYVSSRSASRGQLHFNRYPMGMNTLSFPHPDLVFYNDIPARRSSFAPIQRHLHQG